MAYTKADLKHDLAAMGLTGNETILIHSSMKSIGTVEGGADTVLDALMEFFAEGLLRFINEENRVFDVRRSPCCVGILPELFRQRPGVVRSLHPTHSIAAYGKDAAAYIEGELDANTPCTPGGCYDRLRAAHGKVLLLGVTHARNTFIHSVEEVLNVPNRLTDKPMQMTVVDEAATTTRSSRTSRRISSSWSRRIWTAAQPGTRNSAMQPAFCAMLRGFSGSPAMFLPQIPKPLSQSLSSRRSAGRRFAPAKPKTLPVIAARCRSCRKEIGCAWFLWINM